MRNDLTTNKQLYSFEQNTLKMIVDDEIGMMAKKESRETKEGTMNHSYSNYMMAKKESIR